MPAFATATNPAQFMLIAHRRLREAQALLSAREWSGAMYLAGYTVECGLKAIIAGENRKRLPPALAIHDLQKLTEQVRTRLSHEECLLLATLPTWNHNIRYVCKAPSAATAAQFVNTVKEIHRCLQNYM